MPHDPLELFWLLAHADSPVLPYDQFRLIPEKVSKALLDAGLLQETQPSRIVECDGCEDGHVEEVQQVNYSDGKRRFFISCPECACVEVDPKRLRQWIPDYSKVAELLHKGLNCKGSIQAMVPQTLWNVGRAALAGQSRPVWLARVIGDEIKQKLPTGKQPILFTIFPQHSEVDCFEPDRTFQVSQLITIEEGQIYFDSDAVQKQLESILQQSFPQKKAKRRETRATTIDALKKEIRAEILSRKSALSQDWDVNLPAPEQKHFAKLLEVSPASIHRALNDNDKELKILWDVVNDPRQIMIFNGE